jgi:hypothetical protein
MKQHVCPVPGPGESFARDFVCDQCGWEWRLNTTVWRWYRFVPAVVK